MLRASMIAAADAELQNIRSSVIFLRRPSEEANLKDANGLCVLLLGVPVATLGRPYTRRDPHIMSWNVTDLRVSPLFPIRSLSLLRSLDFSESEICQSTNP